MRLIFVLLITLNMAYAVWEALFQTPDVPKAGNTETTRWPASPKPLLLGSEARGAVQGSPSESLIPIIALGHMESGRNDSRALVRQALASLLRSPYGEAGGQHASRYADGTPLISDYAEQAGNEAGPRCIEAGPFARNALAESMLVEMKEYISEGFVRTEKQAGRSVFWVHVPPRSNRADAKTLVRSLGKRGIASFVIADEGPLRNGVSLGVYHDEASANRFARKISNIGFPVMVYRSVQERTGYFAHASVVDGAGPALATALVEFVTKNEPSAVIAETPCRGVAVE
ncbi:MAG: SPOR domain-containing protein [Gammaproteobacteria bacterium]|jgi:hypothetical protein|nr:SPOR domain-containing protein [Gammaproteobacteria bacterium]MBK7167771.1 SPOR domain-containing protein [Gammaproteobacteria bacterium]MBK7518633.1 SPOR domain-containing protein [Gammaproteobacteria bacterium]MBK8307391.1 SPOR domain-containing protein [Gammaproteobacteria bacterium]MBK9665125.1 SPOR domain-containing protein [Gammaproteobacteria bacterium]